MIPFLKVLIEIPLAEGYSGWLFGENLKGLGQFFQSKIGSWPHQANSLFSGFANPVSP
jgi:hypothetical protein